MTWRFSKYDLTISISNDGTQDVEIMPSTPMQKRKYQRWNRRCCLWRQEIVDNTTVGGFSLGLFPNKMTMTFYVLLVNLVCIIFFYEQNVINYIDIIPERIFGFSIFKDYHCKDIKLSSLIEYYRSLHHQFSFWLSSFCSQLLPYFVHPAIQPHDFSHSTVCLCCSLYWKCLSNSSLMTNLLSGFRIH